MSNSGRNCTRCSEGTYERNNTNCIECSMGYVARAGTSASCSKCATGTLLCFSFYSHFYFIFYINFVLIGFNITLSECLSCSANTYSSIDSTIATCVMCESGTYSLPNSTNCTKCTNGISFHYFKITYFICFYLLYS